jgi:type IV secretory pathway VirD2 relaxase
MADDDIKPKLGRIRDNSGTRLPSLRQQVLKQAGKSGLRAQWSKGHIKPGQLRRGMGTGLRAAAGIVAPGSRRVIVKARYTRIAAGDLGAARAHLRYIQRDGVTREGERGQLYNASREDVDGGAFLDRSTNDPHQFRFIVSAEDSGQLANLKPFVRDLMAQMERDLDTKLDWVAVDHFNTGHPHTHIVIRGKDDKGEDLVMARTYIGHGVRARAQGLITLQLGPETQVEKLQKLRIEVDQEHLTRLDRAILGQANSNVLVVSASEDRDPTRRALRMGRLKTLERLGLAEERQTGVWQLDRAMEPKLRLLGDRADKFKMMQRALKEAGIDRAASAMALFEKKPRKVPLIGKVVGVGIVDEITDRSWVIVDAVDGRVHYAELGRLQPENVPRKGMLVALAGDNLTEKPNRVPTLLVLSPVPVDRLTTYEGPTWLDEAIVSKWKPEAMMPGMAAEISSAIVARSLWLADRQLAGASSPTDTTPAPNMMTALRKMEVERLVTDVSKQMNAEFVPAALGARVTGIYERSILTPSGKIAVIRNQDTFTLAPWKPALEPMRGMAVTATLGNGRVAWTLDRGRDLPPRA